MRSFRAGRIAAKKVSPPKNAPVFSVLLLALASAGCPQLNRQPDYMGNQLMSVDRRLPAIAAAEPPAGQRQAFDPGNSMLAE